ncbi:MAG: polysaccharide biosynthesis C-terminal domain-containing protein [Prevotellaceae bacterium]|nr:polysaccharide biosynthesis C-terminal domain-containing protein [Prevotellaceae bacterium]
MQGSNQSYRHILRYTGIFGSIQAVTMLASILRNKAAALLIDRYGQGLADLFSNTANLISTATTLVMPVSVVRRLSQIYERSGEHSSALSEEIKVVRSWSVLTGLVAMAIVAGAAPLLSVLTFGGTHFTRSYLFLSPLLLFLSINGTEVAILKATRQLRQLAVASVVAAVATLIICVISYWLWSLRGIVISLDLSLLATALLNLRYTVKAYPYSAAPFSWRVLRRGGELIRLSISFLLASVAAALAEMLIRAFISNHGSIEDVGLYGAGFVLSVTYTKFIFSAMDADFYPRLSGIAGDAGTGTIQRAGEMNLLINRQIVVCVLLIVPCLLLFTLFLPQVIDILYKPEYREVIPMVMCATIYMFSKAINTPVAYVSLAKGDSRMYLLIESIAALLLGAFVIAGYAAAGLTGSGIGLALSNVVELFVIVLVYNRAYGVLLSLSTLAVILTQLLLLVAGLLSIAFFADNDHALLRYPIVLVLIAFSAVFAWRVIKRK